MSTIAVSLTSNYFELFGLTAGFSIDQRQLSEKYRKLQNLVHPDKYATANDIERRMSIQQSSFINQAYQTLSNPLSRAKYLLEINGVDLASDTDTAMAPEFLMQQMELRELLEEIDNNASPLAAIEKLTAQVDSFANVVKSKITGIFDANEKPDLEKARDWVRRWQFMDKLQDEISEKEERYS